MMDLQRCIKELEENNGLVRVLDEVDPVYELAGVARHFEGGPAVLFEKVKGGDFPVLVGLYWNRENVGRLFGCSARRLPFAIAEGVERWAAGPVAPVVVDDAPVQQVAQPRPDLYKIPTPTLCLGDGGPYYANSVVVAKDPETGVRNASVHRIMVTGKDRMTTHLGVGGHLLDYQTRAEKLGKPLEVTISNGLDPAVYFAAIVPSASVPIEKDELGIASALRGEPLRLSRSRTVAVEGIADAQVVIEGEILPDVREDEGPFGEATGYYGSLGKRYVIRVKAVTHRENPVVSALLPGMEVSNSLGLPAEVSLYNVLCGQMPGIRAVHYSHGGCGSYHAVIQMEPARRGMAKGAIFAAFGANPILQMVTVVNEDVDIFDANEVQWAMSTRFRPDEDMVLLPKSAAQNLNPITDGGYCAKVGFDCTVDLPKSPKFERTTIQQVDISRYRTGP